MRTLFFSIVLVLAAIFEVQAQHAPQYSNFMFNKLAYNPAYAGSNDMMTILAIYRNQWTGLDGAPETMNLNIHAPFWQKSCGIGLSISNDQIGLLQSTSINLSYSYRLKVGEESTLGLGLVGRMEHGRINWGKADPLHPTDAMLGFNGNSKWQPNFGAGLYLSSPTYYVGISAPQLLKNNLYSDAQVGQEVRTYYLMAGFVKAVNEYVKVKPAILWSYNSGAPFEFDLNLNFIFMDALWVGGSYRLGDSFDAIVAYQFNPQFRLGLAADFTTSELRNHTSGSFELMLQYAFSYEKTDIVNLRYF